MKLAIVDGRMPEKMKRTLLCRGFYLIETAAYDALPTPTSAHPDMLMFFHGNTLISSADYCEKAPYIFEDISRHVPNLKLIFTDDKPSKSYPNDTVFNALVMGNRLFAKERSVSKEILKYAALCGLETVNVSQGYPACTVLAVNEDNAITADRGMKATLSRNGISVTLIENGDISLPPYEYGFIGGAAGVFGNDIYFMGEIRRHRDYEKISKALKNLGFNLVSLSDGELLDLGRIIFIDGDV